LRKLANVLKEFAWPFGLMGGIYGYATRFVPQEWTVSLWICGAVVAVLLSVIISLIWHLAQREQRPFITIKVEQVLSGGAQFLTEPTENLGFDMGVRAYYRDGKHELLLGTGVVRNAQGDRRCLLDIQYETGADADLLAKLAENNEAVRGRLTLRPGIMIRDITQ